MEEKFMRVLVMFDVPMRTKKERKSYTVFRRKLIHSGFIMLQYSIYMRICKGVASANNYLEKLAMIAPDYGHVRVLLLTEKQFDNMKIFVGIKSPSEEANCPKQLTLF